MWQFGFGGPDMERLVAVHHLGIRNNCFIFACASPPCEETAGKLDNMTHEKQSEDLKEYFRI
jgi:hypothetical protein